MKIIYFESGKKSHQHNQFNVKGNTEKFNENYIKSLRFFFSSESPVGTTPELQIFEAIFPDKSNSLLNFVHTMENLMVPSTKSN